MRKRPAEHTLTQEHPHHHHHHNPTLPPQPPTNTIGELISRLLPPGPFTAATVRYVDLPFLYRNLKAEDTSTSASSAADDEGGKSRSKGKGKGGGKEDEKDDDGGGGSGRSKGKGVKAGGGGHGHKRCVAYVVSNPHIYLAHAPHLLSYLQQTQHANTSPGYARLGEPEPFASPADPTTSITHLCPRTADPTLVNVQPFEFVAVHGVTAEGMRALHGGRSTRCVWLWGLVVVSVLYMVGSEGLIPPPLYIVIIFLTAMMRSRRWAESCWAGMGWWNALLT